jgi:pilus assembly protein CpaE
MATILIAEPGTANAQRLAQAAVASLDPQPPVEVCASLEMALDFAEQNVIDALVIGPSLVGDLAFELSSYLAEANKGATIIVAEALGTDVLRAAMRSSVADVIELGQIETEMPASIARAMAGSRKMHPVESGALPAPDKQVLAKVVTVFSTKGGVGKSVLSTNLAVAIAKTSGKRVAIIDLDLEFGDVGIMLGLKPQHTLFDAVQAFDRLDAEMLLGLMQTHDSGVKVMLAPVRPEDAEAVSAARVAHVIKLMRENFDYVVIDTSPSFSDAVLAALDRSDTIFVITTMDVASIKNTRISMQKLRQLGFENGRVNLVLNRSDSKVLLEPAEVERALGDRIVAHIPSDRCVPRAVNKGVPVITDVPRCNVSRSIMGLAQVVTAQHPTKES